MGEKYTPHPKHSTGRSISTKSPSAGVKNPMTKGNPGKGNGTKANGGTAGGGKGRSGY